MNEIAGTRNVVESGYYNEQEKKKVHQAAL